MGDSRDGRETADKAEEKANVHRKDWLVPFLLLCTRDGGIYGHELSDRLAGLGFGRMPPAVMYRALRRMEKEGLVLSDGEGSRDRLPGRRYEITGSGEAYLEFWANSLKQYQEEMDLFFEVFTEPSAKKELR